MTREERITELLSDTTQYCPYCGDERGSKFQCCGEVHFQTFYEMTVGEQDDFLHEIVIDLTRSLTDGYY